MEEQHLTEEDLKSLKKQIAEQDFRATGEDYEDFISGPIWDDLKTMLQERVDGLLEQLEGLDNSPQEDVIIKSRLHELRQLLKYPEHVIELFKITKEESDESDRLAA